MSTRCIECHKEIRWGRENDRGLHARVQQARCARCHPDHAGRDFELIEWEEGSSDDFDHRRSGYQLTGKHKELSCRKCHKPENQNSAVVSLMTRENLGESWLGLETKCVACHDDPHENRLGDSCTKCHDTGGFRPVRSADFDHDQTRYPLRGRHRKIECRACHDSDRRGYDLPRFDRCTACHDNAHSAQLAARDRRSNDCNSCHGLDTFSPSIFTRERHKNGGYPLEGRHAKVACSECHPKNPPGYSRSLLGSAGILFARPHDACTDCHQDAHAGQLAHRSDKGECSTCHRVSGWLPSTFTAEDHRELTPPLTGAHRDTKCAACHGRDRPGLPAWPDPAFLGKAGVGLKLGALDCASCHHNPHLPAKTDARGDTYKSYRRCDECHGDRSFHPSTIAIEDHDDFTFRLEGAHRSVPCVFCHKDFTAHESRSSLLLAANPSPPILFQPSRGSCTDCHDNPHGEQFSDRSTRNECRDCHGTDDFKPADRFNHDRDSSFPLDGSHKTVSCEKCHRQERRDDGSTIIRYRPIESSCRTCHAALPADTVHRKSMSFRSNPVDRQELESPDLRVPPPKTLSRILEAWERRKDRAHP